MEFKDLPSVEALLIELREAWPDCPHALLRQEAQRAIAEARAAIRDERTPARPLQAANEAITAINRSSLRNVINATGVILHTNLGRAPLPELRIPGGYCNLEYDLARGARGRRDSHIATLLRAITGAETIAVNNNAAAVYLVLNALAAGGDVVVSRGELIEIGDGFRIPDIMRAAGVNLIEVGATNRTRIEDYQAAVTPNTRLLLRVHPSNFHIEGFTGKPDLNRLVELGRAIGVPVYEDLGSGCLIDLKPYGISEPTIGESLRAGVAVVSFSGDKLLGGTQAGFIGGESDLVRRIRRHPMYRALRLDKLVLTALERMLRSLALERYHEVPALTMIRLSKEDITARAEAFLQQLPPGVKATLVDGESLAGGGSTPDQTLPTTLIAISGDVTRLEATLRSNDPPIIARIEEDRLLVDLRTVLPEEEAALSAALS